MGFRTNLANFIAGTGTSRRPRPTSRKDSLSTGVILSLGPQAAKWMTSNYQTFVTEGFLGNPYVYASIRLISTTAAGIPWRAYSAPTKKKEYDDHPILTLLHRPNPLQSQARFFETMIGYLLLDGNSYIERAGGRTPAGPNGVTVTPAGSLMAVAPTGASGALPDELYCLRPDRMRIIEGTQRAPIAGYQYSVGQASVVFPEPTIRHLKLFHPLNDWYGLSPIQSASKSIDQSNQSKAWNLSLLQNGGRPMGALKTPLNVEDSQYQRLKEWIEEQHAGYTNAGRPVILEAGIEWAQMGLSPDDMAWLEGQKLSAREIAMVYNVAPELIGDPESKTYSNYGEARKALLEENVLPLLDWIRDEFNAWLCEPAGVYVDYDRDEIEALQEDRNAIYTRNNAAFTAGWITINDAREMASMDKDPVAGDYYKWQLPVSAPVDPTVEQPEPTVLITPSYNPTGATLPYPNLPATHPLNQGPPSLLPAPAEPPTPTDEPPTPPTPPGAKAGERRHDVIPFPPKERGSA